MARLHDGSRKVTHVSEVLGYDLATMKYDIQDLFVRKWHTDRNEGTTTSELVPTGLLPRCLSQLHEHGTDVPEGVYEAAERLRADGGTGGE